MTEAPQNSERLVLSVAEAASLLGISRSTAYQSIKDGLIPSLKVGRVRVVVPRRAFERMLEARLAPAEVE